MSGYRPSQWGEYQGDMQELILIKPCIVEKDFGGSDYAAGTDQGYFFDAIIREEHSMTSRKTEHPAQTGTAITDHRYNLPDRLVLDIAMSDVMDSFYPGQWEAGSSGSRSVNAFQTLKRLQKQGKLLDVTTRLNTYRNMGIMANNGIAEYKTANGMRCTVMLEEFIFSTISEKTVSTRKDTTDKTEKGTLQPYEPSASMLNKKNMLVLGATD
jgi:hypothetical protein